MNTDNRSDRLSTILNRLQDLDDLVERRCRCREQKRCRAATRVKIANSAKRFSRCFHRVAAQRAVHMKIDKTGRKIISIEINDLVFPVRQGALADRSDFSFFYDNFKTDSNSVGKI